MPRSTTTDDGRVQRFTTDGCAVSRKDGITPILYIVIRDGKTAKTVIK